MRYFSAHLMLLLPPWTRKWGAVNRSHTSSVLYVLIYWHVFTFCRCYLWRVRTWWASRWPTVESLTWSSKTAPRWCSFMVTDRQGGWYLMIHTDVSLFFCIICTLLKMYQQSYCRKWCIGKHTIKGHISAKSLDEHFGWSWMHQAGKWHTIQSALWMRSCL